MGRQRHRLPVRQQVALSDGGGRGLTIIDALSTDWGACREADGKIALWALIGPVPSLGLSPVIG